MNPTAVLSIGAAVLLVAVAASSGTAPAATPASQKAGLEAFETVRAVLQHPRCQNCHIPGDAPLQLDQGIAHVQNVLRGPDGKGAPGLSCATCHGDSNPPSNWGAHMPPGAPGWRLPGPDKKMVFIGLSSGELCRRLKDPAENGGRSLELLLRHVSDDKLVLWGWSPGEGREPVSIPHAEFVEKFKAWVASGAPCPAP
jgi:hypothetical protein